MLELVQPLAPRALTTQRHTSTSPIPASRTLTCRSSTPTELSKLGPRLHRSHHHDVGYSLECDPTVGSGGPPYPALLYDSVDRLVPAAPFPPPIPPTPAARLIQVPDLDSTAATRPSTPPAQPTPFVYPTSNASAPGQTVAVPDFPSSNASVLALHDGDTSIMGSNGQNVDGIGNDYPPKQGGNPIPVDTYTTNWPVSTLMTFNGGINLNGGTPPTLVPQSRAVFLQDNNTPLAGSTYAPQTTPPTNPANYNTTPNAMVQAAANNYLGAGSPANILAPPNNVATTATGLSPANDHRQHPLYRTEMLQKIMNLTTVRTHQFAVWITVGFFEVVKPGTPELGIPDVLGQELGLTAGHNVRYRSFFTLDRTKATGFNPYYPGNFRDCVTYRRRIE